jgi:hypothetical protein
MIPLDLFCAYSLAQHGRCIYRQSPPVSRMMQCNMAGVNIER